MDTPPADAPTSEDLIPRRGSTSVAWKYFGFEKTDVTQKTVICKVCRKAVAAKSSSTTNLFHHLRTNHTKEYEECQKLAAKEKPKSAKVTLPAAQHSQQTLEDSINRKLPYDKKSTRWRDVTNAITNYIAKEMVPIQVVEREGFKQLVNTLDPRYTVPGRKYFSETALPNLYDSCRQTLMNELQKVQHFATTTDLWSSRTSDPYLSLTVHFIDESWQLKSNCLQTSFLTNIPLLFLDFFCNTGQNLKLVIVLYDYKLDLFVCNFCRTCWSTLNLKSLFYMTVS